MKSKYFVHESSFIDDDVNISDGVKIWHFCHILKKTTIGSNSSFGQNCSIGPNVRIGSNVKVQNNVSIYEGVHIEDDVFLGPSCVFTNVLNPRSQINRRDSFLLTRVKKGASIGANATIICGVKLGRYCLIGAGAVVTKDVPDFALMTGCPAVRTGWVSKSGDILDEELVCSIDGSIYEEIGHNKLIEKNE